MLRKNLLIWGFSFGRVRICSFWHFQSPENTFHEVCSLYVSRMRMWRIEDQKILAVSKADFISNHLYVDVFAPIRLKPTTLPCQPNLQFCQLLIIPYFIIFGAWWWYWCIFLNFTITDINSTALLIQICLFWIHQSSFWKQLWWRSTCMLFTSARTAVQSHTLSLVWHGGFQQPLRQSQRSQFSFP